MQEHLFPEERRERIVALVDERAKVRVSEFCDMFNVSSATVRNDMRVLEQEKRIKRTHGGALALSQARHEKKDMEKLVSAVDEKRRIAEYAATLIEPGDTLALDTGTTTRELAKLISGMEELTVVTNDLLIAAMLSDNPKVTTIVLGGVVRVGYSCTVGAIAKNMLLDMSIDKAFMATNGFSVSKGFTTPTSEQAEVKKMLISASMQTVMLMDSSKFAKQYFLKFADISQIDALITDKGISDAMTITLSSMNGDMELVTV